MTLEECLRKVVSLGASDLHVKVGRPPLMRSKGDLVPIEGADVMTQETIQREVLSLITPVQWQKLENEKELDFSFQLGELARFRGNAFFQRGVLSAVFRAIPPNMPTVEELGLPQVLKELVARPQGLFLVTGPTGSGKTTTLAALVQYVNENFAKHIITIEDPIEFTYKDAKSAVNQREVGMDTMNFSQALRRALRQDPDVIMMGELRDQETISTAMTAAETGHLVLGTLHTNDAAQSISRIVDTFPAEAQNQVRIQIAAVLVCIVSQRLIKRMDGQGRIAAVELLINTPSIRKLIEENRIGGISKMVEESASFYKMQTFNQALFNLIKEKKITTEEAFAISENPNDLRIRLQSEGVSTSSQKSSLPPGLHVE